MKNQTSYPPSSPPRKGLAIWSLVLGIIGIPTLGLCFVGGIAGLVLGIVALGNAKSKPAQYTGKGIAIAGIITSSLSLLIAIPGLIAAIAIPNLLKSAQVARETAAFAEVHRIGEAQVTYSLNKGSGKFTSLRTLGDEGLIDATLASGQKGGYIFTSEPIPGAREPMFETTAMPLTAGTFGTGNRSFGSNETMVVYEAAGAVEVKGTPTNRIPPAGRPVQGNLDRPRYRR